MNPIEEYIANAIKNSGGKSLEYWTWIENNMEYFEGQNNANYSLASVLDINEHDCHTNSALVSLSLDKEYYFGFFVGGNVPDLPYEHSFNVENGVVEDYTASLYLPDAFLWGGVHIPNDVVRDFYMSDEVTKYTHILWYYYNTI